MIYWSLESAGCVPVVACNWYAWLRDTVTKELGFQCSLKDMPDPIKVQIRLFRDLGAMP